MMTHSHQFILRDYDGKFRYCLDCGGKERIIPSSPIKATLCKACGETFIQASESELIACVKCRNGGNQ